MKIDKFRILYVLLCGVLPVCLSAAGNSYEQELDKALASRVEQGEPVWLDNTGDRFFGIYHQQLTDKAQGAVIIIHNMGGHPDWPQVVAPLRLQLPAGGWATLSIQMPVLEPGEALADYGDTIKQASNRIRAAVRDLREKKFLNIVLVGYGFGATTGACYLAGDGGGIQAFAGIGMQSYDFLSPRLNLDDCLARIDIPVLDLYGSRDFDEVLRLAVNRRLEARKLNMNRYLQVTIDGADHYYSGLEGVMVQRIRGWLDKAAPGVRVIADEKLQDRINSDNEKEQSDQ